MKHGFSAALALAGLTAAYGANAQVIDNEAGFYAGAGVGEFDVEIDDVDELDDEIEGYDSDDTAWKAFIGWRANPWLALELAYVNLGSPDDEIGPGSTLRTETDGFAPYLVGTLPIGAWFEVFAKAGYYWYDTDVLLSTPAGNFRASESEDTFTWSAGLGVNFFERFNVRLEYESFDLDDRDDSQALWLTGAVRF